MWLDCFDQFLFILRVTSCGGLLDFRSSRVSTLESKTVGKSVISEDLADAFRMLALRRQMYVPLMKLWDQQLRTI